MSGVFEYFVILAEMRTGSNYLEENLNEYPGLQCHGELFNPHFLGGPNKTEKFGVSIQERDANPLIMIGKLKSFSDGLHGFRYFHDHDPRILKDCLEDTQCAKIILTRNPVESYVSREIVRQTQQWRLGDLKSAKSARIKFDAAEFATHLRLHQQFQEQILKTLQISGQTGFYLAYEDISEVDIVNGLARFLGISASRRKPVTTTKKQNPQPLSEKVTNFGEMEKALSSVDYFSLNALPNFEPRRGAQMPGYVASSNPPLLFLPIASGPTEPVIAWLAELDGVARDELVSGFTQKSLRHWKRKSGKHRTFTVIRHPVLRLHDAFVRHILMFGGQSFAAIRQHLISYHGLAIPEHGRDDTYDAQAHKSAFISFAGFVQGNLAGQTSIRVDPAWASQSEILRGYGQFVLPDHVFREEDLASGLAQLAKQFGRKSPKLTAPADQSPITLPDIYDADVEKAVKSAYQRDYMMFGFGPWNT